MLTFIYRLSISTSRKVRPSWPQIRSKLKSFETFIDADAMVLLYSLDSCELSREHTFRTFGGGAKRLERFWEQSHTPTTSRTIIIFSWVSVTRALYTSVPKYPKMSPNVPGWDWMSWVLIDILSGVASGLWAFLQSFGYFHQ